MWYILSGVFGAVVGSFLNVIIYRLPREGLKLWDPLCSFCPHCGHRLSIRDNIPIFSYMLLRGRCRYCDAKIPLRYFLVEVFNASLYPLVWWLSDDILVTIAGWILVSVLLAIAFMDLETWHIHDSLLLSLFVVSLFLAWRMGTLFYGAITAAGAFILFYILYRFKRGLGFGDVLMVGAAGFYMDIFTFDIALLIAAVTGLIYAFVKYKGFKPKEKIPFGPFLSFGFIFGLIIKLWR